MNSWCWITKRGGTAFRGWLKIWLALMVGMLIGSGLIAASWAAGKWDPVEKDGLHDPNGPEIKTLQQPQEALTPLPPDTAGNKVRWVEALRQGVIQPRTNIYPDTRIEILDLDLIYEKTGDSPYVRFPHRPHTEWLACSNCHEQIFKTKFGATKFTMMQILQGESCGRCHGAVAFPLTECSRCHSVNPDSFRGKFGPQSAVPPEAYNAGKATAKPAAKPTAKSGGKP